MGRHLSPRYGQVIHFRKCESKHWFSCGVVGRSVYSHVITKFFEMGRFTQLWGSSVHVELRYKLASEGL